MQRAFPLALALAATSAAAAVVHAQSPDVRDDRARAVHVLNRLTFGPRPGEVERVLQMGVDRWVEQQLSVDAAEDSLLPTLMQCQLWARALNEIANLPHVVDAKGADGTMMRMRIVVLGGFNFDRPRDATAAGRQVYESDRRMMGCRMMRLERSERQLLEVMGDFWLNHFYIASLGYPSRASYAQYDRGVIRPHALGRFRDLLGAVAHTPAMLAYLNNDVNGPLDTEPSLAEYRRSKVPGTIPRTGLNENYARELLELHTLGVDGGYTQADVIGVARAFSGWTHTGWVYGCVEPERVDQFRSTCRQRNVTAPEFMFDSTKHDAGTKTVLGHTLAAGRGTEDAEEVLDILARHPSTARFIARKLAIRFIGDAPPESIVERAAQTFLSTDGDIRAVLRTIVQSEEFANSQRAKVKSPLELVLSVRRALNATFDGNGDAVDAMFDMEQPPLGRRSPDGWPDNAAQWLSTASMIARINYAHDVATRGYSSIRLEEWPGWEKLINEPYTTQVDGVVDLLLHGRAGPELRAALLAAEPLHAQPGSAAAREESLRKVIALVLGSPDFQRR
jgi:uncharacterized protein (DUF1800 family)